MGRYGRRTGTGARYVDGIAKEQVALDSGVLLDIYFRRTKVGVLLLRVVAQIERARLVISLSYLIMSIGNRAKDTNAWAFHEADMILKE